LKRAEFVAWGCALIAAKAVGLVDDLTEAAVRSAQADGAPFIPCAEAHTLYQPLTAKYIHLQGTLSNEVRSDEGTSNA
jgi:sugar (pentulose or hexulose) kinase